MNIVSQPLEPWHILLYFSELKCTVRIKIAVNHE